MRTLCVPLLAVLAAMFFTTTGSAQEPPATPAADPRHSQFDFWVGDWDAAFGDNQKSRNTVTRILDGRVILENFVGAPDLPLTGMSVSVFNDRLGKWQQTWVDNQGGYLDFVGEFADGRMILSRTATDREGKAFLQRMVWHGIGKDAFDWSWERSDDGGTTWTSVWEIRYTRRM